MREWITNLLLIGISIAFLVHFIMIKIYGSVVISEPNKLILGLEIVGFIAIIGFGIWNIVKIECLRKE